MVGRTLSHYRITAKLGKGGMGEVYCASDTRLGRDVAVKVLPAEMASDPERLARFEREARSLATLNHPNIVTIHSVEEADGVHFLTMELVAGQTLERVIPATGLPLPRLFDLAIPIADALAAAHAKGITHRDLKPANVMVTEGGRVKILDFGLAKLEVQEGDEEETELLTQEGLVVGTVAYMSPEQVQSKPVDHRTDIFSLGVLVYEMATGRRPFRGENAASVISSLLRDHPPAVTEIRAELPNHLARVVRRCLEKEAERRYQSALDVRNELQELTEDLASDASEGPLPPKRPVPRRPATGRWLRGWRWVAITAVLVAFAIVGFLALRPPAGGPAASGEAETRAAASAPRREMIVVLPFENLGPPDDEYFAAGMTEEITSRLAAVSGLGVVSRSSANQYAKTTKKTAEIGAELGVDYLLAGTVRWAQEAAGAPRIRITPRLISVADDTHLWTSSYDRLLDDVFEIQSEIAARVVAELGVTLLEPERSIVEGRPTENLEAYRLFLRGEYNLTGPTWTSFESLRRAVEQFQRAVDLDPEFVAAWRALMHAQARIYGFGHDTSPQRRELARRALDRAVELAPDDPETLVHKGLYLHNVERDYEAALEQYSRAEQGSTTADVAANQAFALRRLGRFAEAAAKLRRVLELDPRNGRLAWDLAETYLHLRRYSEAESLADLSLALDPEWGLSYRIKTDVQLRRAGSTAGARAVLDGVPASVRSSSGYDWVWVEYWLDLYEGRYGQAVERLAKSSKRRPGSPVYFHPKELLEAYAYSLRDESQRSQASYRSARKILEAELAETPDHAKLLGPLGVACAGLGLKEEAIRHTRRATELVPLAKEGFFGLTHIEDLAWVYALLGERDAALAELELLLRRPSQISFPLLELDPRWASLRGHPRYRELRSEFGASAAADADPAKGPDAESGDAGS